MPRLLILTHKVIPISRRFEQMEVMVYKEEHDEEALDDLTECASAVCIVLIKWKTIGSFTDIFIVPCAEIAAIWYIIAAVVISVVPPPP